MNNMNGQDLPQFDPFNKHPFGKRKTDSRSIDERIRQDYGEKEYQKMLKQREIDKAKGDTCPPGFGL